MKSKSKPFFCSVYYHSKCCMLAEKTKNNISGSDLARGFW